MKGIFLLLFFIGSISGYAQETKKYIPDISGVVTKKNPLSDKEMENWSHKDIIDDSIPGISLEKAYRELLPGKKGQEVIVAVLDTKLDIHHEDLKRQLWVNTDEIPGNGIDDDKNGYIDDIYGWDFLSNSKGEYIKYEHYEMVRIIKKYDTFFRGKSEKDIAPENVAKYTLYTKTKMSYENWVENVKAYLKRLDYRIATYPKAKATLKRFFPDENYSIAQLDSLSKKHQNDSLIYAHAMFMMDAIKYKRTPENSKRYKDRYTHVLKTSLNLDFDERAIISDDPEDISDAYYGYNQVWGDVPFQHATMVAGILGATRSNHLGVMGFSDRIRIMPVVMVATGDEHDKDVAIAIRYAVDNGAKVINMSWGKDFSMHEDWVLDAIKYAAEKDVVLVTGSGNSATNIDIQKTYPNDYIGDKEIADNFIMVGASDYKADKNLIAYFSSYGKRHVDIFAPGDDIYTTAHGNTYEFGGGTSASAPMVSGIAALLRSYYPKLSAAEVKNIILESGVSYNINVNVPGTNGKEQKLFSEFSKSGKIVNAYNALLMAGKMAK